MSAQSSAHRVRFDIIQYEKCFPLVFHDDFRGDCFFHAILDQVKAASGTRAETVVDTVEWSLLLQREPSVMPTTMKTQFDHFQSVSNVQYMAFGEEEQCSSAVFCAKLRYLGSNIPNVSSHIVAVLLGERAFNVKLLNALCAAGKEVILLHWSKSDLLPAGQGFTACNTRVFDGSPLLDPNIKRFQCSSQSLRDVYSVYAPHASPPPLPRPLFTAEQLEAGKTVRILFYGPTHWSPLDVFTRARHLARAADVFVKNVEELHSHGAVLPSQAACARTKPYTVVLDGDKHPPDTHAACAEMLVHQEVEIERLDDGYKAQLRFDVVQVDQPSAAPNLDVPESPPAPHPNDTEAELTFDEACRKLENDINEHVLCLHCPFCDMVILPEWDRCDALKCDACMQWFCGLCLSVSSDGDAEKAHDCAHDCRLKHPAPQPGELDPAHVEVKQRALHSTLQRYDDTVCIAVLQLPRVRDSLVGVPLQIPPGYMCSDALVEDGDHDAPAPPPAPETESKDPTLHLRDTAQATTLLDEAAAPPGSPAETTVVSHSDTIGAHPGAGGKDRVASADALPCSTAEGSVVQVVPFTEQDQERAEAERQHLEGGDTDGDNDTLSDDNGSVVGSDSDSHDIEAHSGLDGHDSEMGDDEGKDGCDTDGSDTEANALEDADEGSLSEVADGAVDGRPLHHSSGGATWPAAAGAGGAAGGACKGHLEAAGGGGTNVASAQGPAQPLVPPRSGPESQGSAGLSAGGVARVSSSGSRKSEVSI